jgi:hypothetical protein
MTLAVLLVLLLLAAVMVRVEFTRDTNEARLAFGLRGTNVLFVIDTCPDEISPGRLVTRYALYDWKFGLRFEAVWTIHGVVVTVCQ